MNRFARVVFAAVVLCLALPAWADETAASEADQPCACKAISEATTLQSGDFSLQLHSRLQVWGGWVGDDALLTNGDKMQEYGFRLRRARFGFDGDLTKQISYGVTLDLFDQERTGGPLYEAFLAYETCPYATIVAGMTKYPYSKAELMSSASLAHLDRSVGTFAMSPAQTVGVAIESKPWGEHLSILVGVYNGLQRARSFHEGYESVGVSTGNRFERLSFAGRVDLEPLEPVGKAEADLKKEASFRFGVGGGGFFNDGSSIRTWGASGYVHLKAWGVHLFSEVLLDNSQPRTQPTSTSTIKAEVDRLSLQASLGYMILAKTLGVSARVELLDDNRDRDDEGDELIVAGTLSWYVAGNFFKTFVEYQHRQERHGQALDNDHAIAGVQLAF